jgi:hypothetical protein
MGENVSNCTGSSVGAGAGAIVFRNVVDILKSAALQKANRKKLSKHRDTENLPGIQEDAGKSGGRRARYSRTPYQRSSSQKGGILNSTIGARRFGGPGLPWICGER